MSGRRAPPGVDASMRLPARSTASRFSCEDHDTPSERPKRGRPPFEVALDSAGEAEVTAGCLLDLGEPWLLTA